MANKCVCGWGSAPDPARGAYSASPDPLAGLRGPTAKGRERERGGERKVGMGCHTSAEGIKGPGRVGDTTPSNRLKRLF